MRHMPSEFWGLSQLAWQAVAALTGSATLVIAIIAAIVAYRQYRANQAVRDEQSRPYVVADFEPSAVAGKLFDFVIRNIGTTPAFEVEIRLDPTPERTREIDGHLLAKSRIFDGTLPMLAPSREIRLFFDSMRRRYKAGLAMSFKVTIAYKNKRGKEFYEETVTDMDIARGSVQFEVYGVHHLAKSLRAIEKTQKKITDHLRNPIQVTTEDWKAHDERMKEEEAEERRSYDEYLQERRRAQSVDGSEQDSYD